MGSCNSKMEPKDYNKKKKAEVVLVGCGAPLRGMGWYHAVQILEGRVDHAKLSYIVEPWLMGPGATGPGGPEFAGFQKKTEDEHGVVFCKSLSELPESSGDGNRLALISGRTTDNPRLLTEAIKAGCKTVYLEKPGAPTVQELETMRKKAADKGVTVLMGYNKNVSKYVTKTREFASSVKEARVTFVSNNTYKPTVNSLGECFERNSEGMLKNMAIHELALLVTFYDVSVENIESVKVDKEFSSMQTLQGPSGKEWTDFDKIKFLIKTKNGKEVSVQADRCGGDVSYATVADKDGEEIFRCEMPDDDDRTNVSLLQEKYPGAMPYFFSQDPDYIIVKDRVADYCANNTEASGIATIDVACETLKVAEYLVPLLQNQLKG